ncbi:ribosomal protein S5, C-terminal domain-containing protein [Aspergillus cavernicola]|uniref:Ribosomal protein S5, C-terminal domain-containing protein n=1 Tax=Aspergillus cavernicola TaxID=176166 RepID=A0ABR4IQ75_9EURO
MSFARPARCLICRFSRAAPTTGPRVPRRQFHLTPTQLDKKDYTLHEISRSMKPEDFKSYTEKEKARLKQQYTPEQLAAIEAGEAAIDPKDLADQFAIRQDPMKLQYLDDFSTIEPGVDKHIRAPESNSDYNATLKTEEDFIDDFARFFAEMPEDATISDWVRFAESTRMTQGKEENELNPNSSLVPDLFQPGETLEGRTSEPPKYFDDGESKARKDMEPDEALKTLMKVTGYSAQEVMRLKARTLVSHAVVNQTRLGKVRSAYVLAVAGNGDGLMGIGEGKSQEAGDARIQATYRAIRNMQPIPRYENRTIFGDVRGKSGAVELKLMSRPPGFGLRCQSLIFEMCRAAGIDDLAARVERSRNPMNTVKAAYQAIMSQRNPEDVARARGKKLVDVRKVYYSGRSDARRF